MRDLIFLYGMLVGSPGQTARQQVQPTLCNSTFEADCLCLSVPCLDLQVVGKKEEDEKTVNVRTRDNKVHGMVSWDELSKVLLEEKCTRSLTSCFGKEHATNFEPKQAQEAAQKGADAAQSQFDRLRVN